MKVEKLTVNFSSEKLRGIKVHAPDVYKNLEQYLTESLEKMYVKSVPQSTRKYIDAIIESEENNIGKGK